ncbi:MAG: hypothetical protein IJ518_01300 [Clostridia bacterium]|nr:hypothetical protein [Clostridia bacterium]
MADDIMRMQREAARRVQRMQEHSRQVMEEHRGRTPESLAAARTPGWPGPAPELRSPGLYVRPEADRPSPAPVEPPPPAPSEHEGKTYLALPTLEAEQWLLLGLALLLFRSGCSTELLLALLYLAM